MKIGIIIFAYNRSQHLQKVLTGLRANVGVSEIYVFQDGLKKEEHREGWEKTKRVIESIDWCEVRYVLSPYNKGLARAIVDGINTVFEENEAVIVLEDDCVPTANFISYMQQCLKKYNDMKKVYNVTGYSLPINVKKDKYDIYFSGRPSSWGWGTWKDRWQEYSIDNGIMDRISKNREKSIDLAIWGNDLEEMFRQRINGKNNSWAVYWALKVIEKGAACIAPYVSLIQNIGFDGTGVHCGTYDGYNVNIEINNSKQYCLPDEVYIYESVKEEFSKFLDGYTAINFEEEKENILIYGVGGFFKRNERKINEKYFIKAFIDREKVGFYAGKNIIRAIDVKKYNFSKIVVMLDDLEESNRVKRMLEEEYGIDRNSIIIWKEFDC